MTHKIYKPDFYTILTRRRSSVALKLESANVLSNKDLKNFIKKLEGHYFISELFIKEANVYIEDLAEAELQEMQEKKDLNSELKSSVVDSKGVQLESDIAISTKPTSRRRNQKRKASAKKD